jgi:phenylacetic acid degradation protein
MPSYSIQGVRPVVHPSAFVHETAVLIGDVIIGPDCYVAPCAVMRGDFGRIVIEAGANVQDTCVIHSFPDRDCRVETNGHIGHGAILHGCTIGRNALVGMNAVVMDDAIIGPESIVGAASFVPAAFRCDARSLVVGTPARVVRTVTDDDMQWKSRGTREYQELARRCADSLQRTTPLTEPEAGRTRLQASNFAPKHDS